MHVNFIRDGLIEESHDFLCTQYSNLDDTNQNMPVYLHTCALPLQMSLLIDYGIDRTHNFTEEEIALMCSSDIDKECTVNIKENLIKKIGLDETFLNECQPANLGINICFGAICKTKNWDLNTYKSTNHPLQILIKHQIYRLCALKWVTDDMLDRYHTTTHYSLSSLEKEKSSVSEEYTAKKYPISVDNYNFPTLSMPLNNLIKGMVNLFCDTKYAKIKNAYIKYPQIIGENERIETFTQNIITVFGENGLCCAINTALHDGFAIKVKDGSISARQIALYKMINQLGWANIEYDTTIKTVSDKIVGKIVVE